MCGREVARGTHASWDIHSVDADRERKGLFGMAESLVVRHVMRALQQLPDGCSTIEIGSGLGKMSFFPALQGADVHLLDSSSAALKTAEHFYRDCRLVVAAHACDALSLSDNMKNRFDISLSLGVNEHFSGDARQAIFKAHFDVLKQGGRTVIAVPNRYCVSYRIAMWMWKLTGRWPKGLYEYGFSRSELIRRMHEAGFDHIEVFSGTYAMDDFHYYIIGNLKAVLRKVGVLGKTRGTLSDELTHVFSVDEIRTKLEKVSPPDIFINPQSYTWIATGIKP